MKCYKCGNSIEAGRTFRPIDPPGKNRRWNCNVCEGKEPETVESVLFGDKKADGNADLLIDRAKSKSGERIPYDSKWK